MLKLKKLIIFSALAACVSVHAQNIKSMEFKNQEKTDILMVFAGELKKSVIPDGVTIGKNVAISGKTEPSDYPDGMLASGGYIVKAGEI